MFPEILMLDSCPRTCEIIRSCYKKKSKDHLKRLTKSLPKSIKFYVCLDLKTQQTYWVKNQVYFFSLELIILIIAGKQEILLKFLKYLWFLRMSYSDTCSLLFISILDAHFTDHWNNGKIDIPVKKERVSYIPAGNLQDVSLLFGFQWNYQHFKDYQEKIWKNYSPFQINKIEVMA